MLDSIEYNIFHSLTAVWFLTWEELARLYLRYLRLLKCYFPPGWASRVHREGSQSILVTSEGLF